MMIHLLEVVDLKLVTGYERSHVFLVTFFKRLGEPVRIPEKKRGLSRLGDIVVSAGTTFMKVQCY